MIRLEALVRELRYATCSLARRRLLTIVALSILALGIGANTAIFSIINVVLLKPLPLSDPDRLVMVWTTTPNQGLTDGFSSYPDFHDWERESNTFAGLAAFWTFPNGDVNLTGGGDPQRVTVARITPGFFEVLGVPPLHGRTFQKEESILGNHRRAILSYSLWHNHLGADTTLVGRSVLVNGFPYTVVGIMPPEVSARSVSVLGTDVQLWRPLVPDDNQTGGRDARQLHVIGRLRSGITIHQAEADLSGVASRLAAQYPESNRETGIRLVPLRQQVVQDVRRGLLFLFGAVGVVLVGACANVANLLLIKASATRKQLAVEHALGASRLQLCARVLSESLILGLVGAGLGAGLAYWGVKAFVAIGPADIPLLADARIDGTVLAFALATALVTTVLVGLLPAWRAGKPETGAVLQQSPIRTGGRDDHRLMRTLGISQIAMAMMLLTIGVLLTRSFRALLRVDPGFNPENVLTFQLELPMGSGMPYSSQPPRDVFFTTLMDRIDALPDVTATSLASAPPLQDEASAAPFTFTLPGEENRGPVRATIQLVAPGYFALLGIPILQGRPFEPTDNRSGARVVIVSAALARAVWGTADPVGRRIDAGFDQAEVIGVAGDVRTGGLDAETARTAYVPAVQYGYNFMTVLVKTRRDPLALVSSIRSVVRELDAALPLHHIRPAQAMVKGSVAQQRFQLLLVGSFSLLMFVLAIIGTYGVTAYQVTERTRELGIRAALGATAGDIRRMVVREGGRLAIIGIPIGGFATIALSRVLTRFVSHVSTLDLATYILVPTVLALATLIAAFVPAHRAAHADPMKALRVE